MPQFHSSPRSRLNAFSDPLHFCTFWNFNNSSNVFSGSGVFKSSRLTSYISLSHVSPSCRLPMAHSISPARQPKIRLPYFPLAWHTPLPSLAQKPAFHHASCILCFVRNIPLYLPGPASVSPLVHSCSSFTLTPDESRLPFMLFCLTILFPSFSHLSIPCAGASISNGKPLFNKRNPTSNR